ncbi:MAG: DUF4386 family protein [Candidatus Eiseniibacteriota bacterium]
MTDRTITRIGGIALIGGALAFMGVFGYLAARFNYPAVLDGRADTVLPSLLATGPQGRMVWAIYAFLPLIWLPAAAGASTALGRNRPGTMRLAELFAVVAALAMMLGLMRWPTIHWELARAFANAGAAERATMAALFDGLNTYLGNYIGEFLGELGFSMFFLLTSVAWLSGSQGPRWVGWLGVLTAAAGFLGMFRNVASLVAPIAAMNNYLLPLFMIVLGIALLRVREVEKRS